MRTPFLFVALIAAASMALGPASSALPPMEPARVAAPVSSDLAAIQRTMELPRATWLNDRDADKVFDALEARFGAEPGARLSVIVTLRHGAGFEASLAAAKVAAGGFRTLYEYPNLGGFNAALTLEQVHAIARLASVRQVEWDQPGTVELDTATEAFGARAVQAALGIDGGDGEPVFDGRDVTVAILDTGFHGGHSDLKGKFRLFLDAEDQAAKEAFDSGTHGTHVAGIVGGTGASDAKYAGVAPGAAFVGFKISAGQAYQGEPAGSKAGALWAYDRILELRDEYDIRVSTISFGFGSTVDGTDALELAVDKVWAAGVVNFKSTGNSGPELGTVTIPGGARGIIAVGNMMDPGASENPVTPSYVSPSLEQSTFDWGFHLAISSSRGPTADGRIKPDLVAPGTSIMAADADSDSGYVPKTGTSMASPFAAGAAALMIDADPDLTPDQVRQVLFATVEDWGAPGPDADYGNGRLRALEAVRVVLMERLARQRAPYEEYLRAWNVTGPDVPYHASGVTTAGGLRAPTFNVERAGLPWSLTVIDNRTQLDPAPIGLPPPAPSPNPPPLRSIVVEVRGPGDAVVGKLSLNHGSRQQGISFLPTAAGTHTVHILGLVSGQEIVYDVSAGLMLPGFGLPGPLGPEDYANVTQVAPEPGGSSPGLGMAAMAVGFVVAAWNVRRRR